jgi:hypothetical protein
LLLRTTLAQRKARRDFRLSQMIIHAHRRGLDSISEAVDIHIRVVRGVGH